MSWLRHAPRHVQGTARLYLRDALVDLGWMNDEPTDTDTSSLPFGPEQATLVTIRDTPAVLTDGTLATNVAAGMLALTVGDEQGPELEELGGPLTSQEYPLFFDIFQDTHATSLALAADVRDILLGRLPGTTSVMPVKNMVGEKDFPGWRMEFEDVVRIQPEHRFPMHWQVVKATATVHFPEVRY